MKALDTNVLARLLLKDDVLQFKKALLCLHPMNNSPPL